MIKLIYDKDIVFLNPDLISSIEVYSSVVDITMSNGNEFTLTGDDAKNALDVIEKHLIIRNR